MELPILELKDEDIRNKVLDIMKPLNIDEVKCQKLLEIFNEELDKGKKYVGKAEIMSITSFKVCSQVSQVLVYRWKTLLFQNF